VRTEHVTSSSSLPSFSSPRKAKVENDSTTDASSPRGTLRALAVCCSCSDTCEEWGSGSGSG